MQVTRLIGGDVKNSVPAYAELGIDLRAATEADLDWAVRELQATGAADGIRFEAEAAGTPPLERTEAVVALAELARQIGRLVGVEIEETSTGGVSDGCWTAHAGITTLDGLGPVGALDHMPDEWADARLRSPPAAGSRRPDLRPSTDALGPDVHAPVVPGLDAQPALPQPRRDRLAAVGRHDDQHAAGRHALARQRRGHALARLHVHGPVPERRIRVGDDPERPRAALHGAPAGDEVADRPLRGRPDVRVTRLEVGHDLGRARLRAPPLAAFRRSARAPRRPRPGRPP